MSDFGGILAAVCVNEVLIKTKEGVYIAPKCASASSSCHH